MNKMVSNLKSNKKGLSFFMLLAIMSVVLFALFSVTVISPHEKSIFDEKFELTLAVDEVNSNRVLEDFFVESYVPYKLDLLKNEYLPYLLAFDKSKASNYDEDKFIGCEYEDEFILFNEKYLQVQIDGSVSEADRNSCFPKFVSGNFKDSFLEYVELDLFSSITDIYDGRGSRYLSNLEVESKDNENFNVLVTSGFLKKVSVGDVNLKSEISIDYYLGKYPNLIMALDKALPELSSRVKTEVYTCKKRDNINSPDKELFCISESFNKLISEVDLSVSQNYIFNLTRVENSGVKDYYGLKFTVFDKNTAKNELEFLSVLKYNLPLGEVDYEIDHYKGYDNILDLIITKSRNAEVEPEYYVVLFSYENFMNKNSYSGYTKLISMLENSKIPVDFNKDHVPGPSGYYTYSLPDSGLDLNLYLINDLDGFDSNNQKHFNIYQIYNHNTGKFETLQSGRKVFFTVFAVDRKFNYLTDEDSLLNILQFEEPRKQFGPRPILKSEIKSFNGDILGMDKSFEFVFSGYNKSLADSYKLYVTKGKGTNRLVPDCNGELEYTCFVKNIPYGSSESEDFKVLVTRGGNANGYDEIVDIDESFGLTNDDEVDFFIVPVTGDAGSYDGQSRSATLEAKDNYFEFSKTSQTQISRLEKFTVKLVDNRAPTIADIEITSTTLNPVDGRLVISWNPVEGSDVTKILVKAALYNPVNSDVQTQIVEILAGSNVDGIPYSVNANSRVVIEKIAPIDSSNNKEYSRINISLSPFNPGIEWINPEFS